MDSHRIELDRKLHSYKYIPEVKAPVFACMFSSLEHWYMCRHPNYLSYASAKPIKSIMVAFEAVAMSPTVGSIYVLTGVVFYQSFTNGTERED